MATSEPTYARSAGEKTDYPWYLTNIDKYLVPETRKLLEEYSGIPPEEQSRHVHEIRDQAWAVRSYPCTGMGLWLVPMIAHSPAYADILSRIKSGGKFLDVGCFMGQDLRKLAFDGAPTSNLYGLDIVSHRDVGYNFFRDRDRFTSHFFEGDLLTAADTTLKDLRGAFDAIEINAVLHQWPWDTQVAAAKQLVALSKPGALVSGYQIGNPTAFASSYGGVQLWRQNREHFAKMWEQVGEETGTRWEVQTWFRSWEEMGWDPADCAWLEAGSQPLEYVMTRVQ